MHTGIHVDHAALATTAEQLMLGARRTDDRLDHLEQELTPLRAEWSGAARGAYDAAKAQWDAAIADLVQLLAQVGHAVEVADAAYRAADQRGAARFGG